MTGPYLFSYLFLWATLMRALLVKARILTEDADGILTITQPVVREVVAHSGMEGFNRAWLAPEGLPSVEEIAEPSLWIARVAGS